MLSILTFLQQIEGAAYLLFALLALRYFWEVLRIQGVLAKTIFPLERELLIKRMNGSVGMVSMIVLTVIAFFIAVHLALPQAVTNSRLQSDSIRKTAITPTPSPTPFIEFGVDMSGCVNSEATISWPKARDTISGVIEIRGTADVNQFAYYTIELGSPDTGDIWMPLFTSKDAAKGKDSVLFKWDSATMPPGVWILRLSVYLRDNTVFGRPCKIPIQVLTP